MRRLSWVPRGLAALVGSLLLLPLGQWSAALAEARSIRVPDEGTSALMECDALRGCSVLITPYVAAWMIFATCAAGLAFAGSWRADRRLLVGAAILGALTALPASLEGARAAASIRHVPIWTAALRSNDTPMLTAVFGTFGLLLLLSAWALSKTRRAAPEA